MTQANTGRRALRMVAVTTDATPTAMQTPDGGDFDLPDATAWGFIAWVVGTRTDTPGAGYSTNKMTGAIRRNVGPSNTQLLGSISNDFQGNEGTGNTWTVAITADATNGALLITVTGAIAEGITWEASIEFTAAPSP